MWAWQANVIGRADRAMAVRANAAVRDELWTATTVTVLAERLAAVQVGLMGTLLLLPAPRRGSVSRMLLGVAVVHAVSEALGHAWRRKRPFVELAHSVVGLVDHAGGRSFPSRHTAAAVAMATIGYRAHPKLGRWMLLIGAALGASRVAAGLHYPTDVAAGAILGAGVGMLLRDGAGDGETSR